MNLLRPEEEEEILGATPTPAPAQTPVKLPGMPPDVTPTDLEGYLGTQKASLNKYGPEQQMELQNSLNERQNSLGYKAKEGLKGFGDAIMQGVAQAGNPGWQRSFQDQQQQFNQDQMSTLKGANDSNLKRTEANMSLDAMSDKSPLSQAKQQAYAPLMQKLGYEPSAIQGMSAANIDNALALYAQYGGKEAEAMIKQFEAQIAASQQATQFEETKRHNAEMENLQRQSGQRDAAESILRTDKKASLLNPLSWFGGLPGDQKKAATDTLAGQLDGGGAHEFKTEEEAAAAGLPDGTPVVVGGVKGTWRN